MKIQINMELDESNDGPSATLETVCSHLPDAMAEIIEDFDPEKMRVAGYSVQLVDIRS